MRLNAKTSVAATDLISSKATMVCYIDRFLVNELGDC